MRQVWRRGCRTGLRTMGMAAFLVVAVGVAGFPRARADILFNTDLVNTTGNVANDYHIRMVAGQPINITNTFETGGDVVFDDALSGGGVSGNGTTDVTINWSGATVNQGQTTHVGASTGIGGGTPNNLVITESWWTFGGVKLVSATSGRLASAMFDGTSGSGLWVVARVSLYDSLAGTNLIGQEWIEGRGTTAEILNLTSDGPIFASWAFTTPGNMIPIEDLNESLGGFGTESSIRQLNAVPEPAALLSVAIGALTLLGYGRRRRRHIVA